MTVGTNRHILESFLQDRPSIQYIPPSSPGFPGARRIFNYSRLDTPLAIVRPQTVFEISDLIKFANHYGIDFTIRAMGHGLEGRAIAQDALTIDVRRALKTIVVSSDRKSATVQGGTSHADVAKILWDEGLTTPLGTVPNVGYVGWAAYGGYGPFSSHWGLGVDQIMGATVIDSNGDIIHADGDLLKGIRGAGGSFGVIVDLTIKVYPLNSVSVDLTFIVYVVAVSF